MIGTDDRVHVSSDKVINCDPQIFPHFFIRSTALMIDFPVFKSVFSSSFLVCSTNGSFRGGWVDYFWEAGQETCQILHGTGRIAC